MTAVSVILSVKNGEPYLQQAIESILNQSLQDIELVIVDNASTDSSRQTIISMKDTRIHYIPLAEDIGQTKALIQGINAAKSPIIARMDADDIAHPHRLEKQLSILNANKDIALIGTNARYISPEGKTVFYKKHKEKHKDICNFFVIENTFTHSSVMFKKDAYYQVGGYDSDFKIFQDYDLWLRFITKYQSYNLPENLIEIRLHENQFSKSNQSLIEQEYSIITKKISNELTLNHQQKNALEFKQKLFNLGKSTFYEKIKLTFELLKHYFTNSIIREYINDLIYRRLKLRQITTK